MRIGLFTDTYYPELNGVATSVYMLKQELEHLGHDVYVFTTTTPGAPEEEHNVYRVSSIPCVFITERRMGKLYSHHLASIIKKLNLDIIHTHTEFSLGIFGRIMATELHIPVVHTYHTIYEDYTHYVIPFETFERGARRVARRYSKLFCNTGRQVIVPTDKVKMLLQRYQVEKEIAVIPTGIDLCKFDHTGYTQEMIEEEKKNLGILPGEKVILYVGRVSHEKNIAELLDGMPQFLEKREDVRFVVIGDGPELPVLKQLAQELGIAERVIFAGAKPWDKIGLYYALGDVFMSASNSETQGLTYIEAMAAGLPVVAKKDDCLNHILINGYNGYAFESKEEMCAALDKVLYEQNDVQYRTNALAVVQEYSKETFAKKVERIYQKQLYLEKPYDWSSRITG